MQKTLLTNPNTRDKISLYHLILLLLSLPFDRFYSHIIFISFAVHTLIHIKKENIKSAFVSNYLWLSSVFLLTSIGALYTQYPSTALAELGRQVPILLFPFLCFINPLKFWRYRKLLFLSFTMGCTFSVLYLYFHTFRVIWYYHLPLSSIFSPLFINHQFSAPIGMHATFYGMQLAVALIYLLAATMQETLRKHQIFYLLCSLVLTAGIIQLSSKSVLIAVLLIVNLALPYFCLAGRQRQKFISYSCIGSFVLMLGVYSIGEFKTRYVTELKKDLGSATKDELTDPRLERWKIGLHIAAQSPFIGHGSGAEVDLLREAYFEHQFYRSYLYHLNAHNQFISILIKFGFLGLLVFLLTLYFGFKTSWVRKDLLLLSFLLIITLVSCAENILDVDKGVFFYSVFFSLLLFSDPTKQTLSV